MKKSKLKGYMLGLLSLLTVVMSFAFFTDNKVNSFNAGLASHTPSYIALEYDLGLGESYVNISNEDLSKQIIRIYKGRYLDNKKNIDEGFAEADYEFEGLTSEEDLRSKIGVTEGIYTVTASSFEGTGKSLGNKGLIGVPYYDIQGLSTENMRGMFKGATSFNQDITGWNVSKVKDMSEMFEGATSYNKDLFDWEVNEDAAHVDFNTGATNLPEYNIPKVWQEEYKVVFEDRGNMVKTIHGGYYNRPLNSTSLGDLELPEEPVSLSHWFMGWKSVEGLEYHEGLVMPKNDVIYEAQWLRKTIDIDTGDGEIEVEVDEDGNITLPDLEDKEDEEFVGWEDEDGNIIEGGEDVEFTEDDKYKPIWKTKEYKVRFENEGVLVDEQTIKHGQDATAPRNPIMDGYTFKGWKGSYVNVKNDVVITAMWDLNPIITKTITFDESTLSNQNQLANIPNLHEVVGVSVGKGSARVTSTEGNEVSLALSGRSYDRREQTGGSYISADTKEVTNQASSNYNTGGYSGTLSQYVHSGVFTPRDTKSVSGQTSSSYDSGGYRGTLSSYLYSGSSEDSKTVTGQTSSNYNSGGYTGTLSRYVSSGSYTPSDTKYVSGQTSSSYNSGGYSGSLSRYVSSGSYTSRDSFYVDGQTSSSYNSGGYSGNLSRYTYSGSYTSSDSKYVTNQGSSWYNSGGYRGSLSSYQERYWVSGNTKYVTNQTSSSYNSGGYSGNLSRYQAGGSLNPGDSKYISERGTVGFSVYCTNSSCRDHQSYSQALSSINSSLRRVKGNTKQYNSGGYIGLLTVTSTNTVSSRGAGYCGGDIVDLGGVYYYTGTVTSAASDTRYYRYQGDVSSSGYYNYYTRYQGNVTKPAVDTRTYRYRGDVVRPASDTRVWRYRGNVTRPSSDTRVYRYSGTVSKPDTRVYRYRGDVTRPESDTRVYRYKGDVSRPESDTRTYQNYYQYEVTIQYREKDSGIAYGEGISTASLDEENNESVVESKEEISSGNNVSGFEYEEEKEEEKEEGIEYEEITYEEITSKEPSYEGEHKAPVKVERDNKGVDSTIKVKLNLNGGVYGELNKFEGELGYTQGNDSKYYVELDIMKGETVGLFSERLVRRGSILTGWKDVTTGEIYDLGSSKRIEKEVVLEAIWEKE